MTTCPWAGEGGILSHSQMYITAVVFCATHHSRHNVDIGVLWQRISPKHQDKTLANLKCSAVANSRRTACAPSTLPMVCTHRQRGGLAAARVPPPLSFGFGVQSPSLQALQGRVLRLSGAGLA